MPLNKETKLLPINYGNDLQDFIEYNVFSNIFVFLEKKNAKFI